MFCANLTHIVCSGLCNFLGPRGLKKHWALSMLACSLYSLPLVSSGMLAWSLLRRLSQYWCRRVREKKVLIDPSKHMSLLGSKEFDRKSEGFHCLWFFSYLACLVCGNRNHRNFSYGLFCMQYYRKISIDSSLMKNSCVFHVAQPNSFYCRLFAFDSCMIQYAVTYQSYVFFFYSCIFRILRTK